MKVHYRVHNIPPLDLILSQFNPATILTKYLKYILILSYNGAGIAEWYSDGLRAGRSGVRFPAGAGNFSLYHLVQTGSGVHAAYYLMGPGALSLGVKRSGSETKTHLHLVPRSRMRGATPPLPQYAFMA
jgi:hypothetical protein